MNSRLWIHVGLCFEWCAYIVITSGAFLREAARPNRRRQNAAEERERLGAGIHQG